MDNLEGGLIRVTIPETVTTHSILRITWPLVLLIEMYLRELFSIDLFNFAILLIFFFFLISHFWKCQLAQLYVPI